MAEWPNSISKKVLWRYVNQKVRRMFNHYHVLGVITILFDEILKDLKDGKPIKIFNFGTLALKETKPRLHYDIVQKRVVQSKSHRILRFNMAPGIHKKLREYLDLDKTLKDD